MARSKIGFGVSPILRAGAIGVAALVPSLALAGEPAPRIVKNFKATHFPGDPAPEGITPFAGGGGPKLTNQGGPVIESIEAVCVFWGAVSSTAQSHCTGMLPAIVASPYIDQLSEYNTSTQKITRGTYKGAFPITPKSATGKSITDQQIATELASQITSGALPKPTYGKAGDANTLYVVYFAPGISISQGQGSSCVSGGFCGYHSDGTYGSKPFPYAVIPDMGAGSGCDQGCSAQGSPETDALGGTVSHEMAEAITDMDVGDNNVAWYDNTNGEIGDICAQQTSGVTNSGQVGPINNYTCQYEWSNKNNKCQLTNPAIPPQGGCTTNTDCSAPNAICDTATSTCVACMVNTDCTGSAAPICDTTAHTCRGCEMNSECSGTTPVCALGGSGSGGADAGAKHDAGGTGSSTGTCVQCATSSDCKSLTAPVCSNNTCGGCKTNADCTTSADPVCNTGTGACGPAGSGSGSGGTGSGSGGTGSGSGGTGSGSGGTGSGSGGTTGDGGTSSGGFNDGPGSSAGCAMTSAPEDSSSGVGLFGMVFGLAAALRIKRSRARR
jgi:hypothetical protein